MSRSRVPLSTYEREKLRPVNRLAVVALLLSVVAAALAVANGHTRTAVLVLAMTLPFCVVALIIRLRILWLTALVLSIGWFMGGLLFGHPVFGALAGVASFAWITIAASRLHLDPQSIQPLESTAVDPEAAHHVAAFEALGFEQVGALSFVPIPGRDVIETIMIGPRRDEYAQVTDLVIDVVSTFGERLLVTRGYASVVLPPECLANDLRGADPAELVAAHRRALEILAARGLKPDAIDRARLVESNLAFERRCMEWATTGFGRRLRQTFFSSGAGFGPLDDGEASRRRIDAWLATPLVLTSAAGSGP